MKRVAFVHVGKTSGSSMWVFLAACNVKAGRSWEVVKKGHKTASTMREELGTEAWEEAVTFSIVRNPIDRYISACRQCKVDANDRKVWGMIEQGLHPYFGDDRTNIFIPQFDSLAIDGEIGVDRVFKFEQDIPEGVVEWLCSQGLCHHTYRHRDPAPEGSEKQQLTPEALTWVKDFYYQDFEAFEYEH